MSILDWLFIGLLSTASLCLVFVVVLFLSSLGTKKKAKSLDNKKKLRNKRKQKRRKKEILFLNNKSRSQVITAIVLLVASVIFGYGSYYSRHYQQTHLGQRDSDAIVQGYYLIDKIDKQLNEAESTDSKVKVGKNIKELSGRLSSYGNRAPDVRLAVEGQRNLTRMYQLMKELGLNLNRQSEEFLDDKEALEAFKNDVKKTKEQQKVVFSYFKINEEALKQKK